MARRSDARLPRLIALASGVLIALVCAFPVSARADLVRAEPGANASLAGGPTTVRLSFTAPPDPQRSTITVFSTDHTRIDSNTLRLAPNDPNALVVDLPAPPKGLYTVVWSATAASDGTASAGAFAFAVDPAQASPAIVTQPQPHFGLQPRQRTIPRWFAFIGIMTVVGAFALRFLVWLPALKRGAGENADDGSFARSVDRRLLLLAGGAVVIFILATIANLAYDVATAAKRSFSAGFDIGLMRGFLATHGAGNLWAVRLVMSALMAAVLLPAAIDALRPSWKRPQRSVHLVMLLGFLFGAGELLVRTLPARVTLGMPRTVFTLLLDWFHLLGASLWVGGLISLVASIPLLRALGAETGTRLSAVIRRFSLVALICVGVLTLTGLWTAWIHVGSIPLLFSTLYGRTLLVKLALAITLVGLGAFNLLWLSPRVTAIRAAGDEQRQSLGAVLLTHFRRVITIEAIIGITILMLVPLLSSSARSQSAQMHAADLTQTAAVAGMPISLRPSALQPGIVNYDVALPVRDAARVSLGFASTELGVPETEVVATAQGGGIYRVTGLYTSMIGRWQTRVTVHQAGQDDRIARFDLPVRATPVTGAAPTPLVRETTWAYGIAEVFLVTSVLAAVWFLSRRQSSAAMLAMAADGTGLTEGTNSSPGVSSVGSVGQERMRVMGNRKLAPIALGLAGLIVLSVLIWQGITQHGSPPDPSDPDSSSLSAGMVVIDSGILVFREGLETVLVLSVITASFLGANAVYRRPVAAGAGVAIAASVATWFIVVAIIDAVNAPALAVQAATGLLAIVVLLVVMNWFFHRVYWAGWIGHHQRRRKQLFEGGGERSQSSIMLGVALLGFTSVYREGFEIVLFLQNLRLQRGTGLVLAGVAVGLVLTTIVGIVTFALHHRLPYKKMLVATGIMLGVVLLIMVGENVQEMQLAGWLPTTEIGLPIPDWVGLWFATFPNVEGLLAQLIAAVVVIGSYFVAQDVRVRRPRLRGETPAYRPEQPPTIGAAPPTLHNGAAGSR